MGWNNLGENDTVHLIDMRVALTNHKMYDFLEVHGDFCFVANVIKGNYKQYVLAISNSRLCSFSGAEKNGLWSVSRL